MVQLFLLAKHFYSEGDQHFPFPAKIKIKKNIIPQSHKSKNRTKIFVQTNHFWSNTKHNINLLLPQKFIYYALLCNNIKLTASVVRLIVNQHTSWRYTLTNITFTHKFIMIIFLTDRISNKYTESTHISR